MTQYRFTILTATSQTNLFESVQLYHCLNSVKQTGGDDDSVLAPSLLSPSVDEMGDDFDENRLHQDFMIGMKE